MLRPVALVVVTSLLAATTGCVSREVYVVPYNTLSTLSTIGPGRYAKTAVYGHREGSDSEVYVRANTLDLDHVESAGNEGVKLSSAMERSTAMIGVEIAAMALGAVLAGIGTWLYLDGTSDTYTGDDKSSKYYTGIACLSAGGALLVGGGVFLGITLGTRPQELGEGKRGFIYLDATGHAPTSAQGYIGVHF